MNFDFVTPLRSLTFAEYRFHLVARDPLLLPRFKGSTLRGVLGWGLRSVLCPFPAEQCLPCPLGERCLYGHIFETPAPKREGRWSRLSHVARPYVVEPPLDEKREYLPGEEFSFGLLLVGRIIDYLPYFVAAFKRAEESAGLGYERGRFTVLGVDEVVMGVPIFLRERRFSGADYRVTRTIDDLLKELNGTDTCRRILIDFVTPTRLKEDEVFTDRPSFRAVFLRAVDRIGMLLEAHCGSTLNGNIRPLVRLSEDVRAESYDLRWVDLFRYSARYQDKIDMSGFVGRVEFSGPLAPFIPFLLLGEKLHVGKYAAFGLGKFVVSYGD